MTDDSKHSREAYRVEQSLAARHYEKEIEQLKTDLKSHSELNRKLANHNHDYFEEVKQLKVDLKLCVDALEFISMPITSSEPTVEGLLNTISIDSFKAKETLSQIKSKVE